MDVEIWNPATDPAHRPRPMTRRDRAGKAANKTALQQSTRPRRGAAHADYRHRLAAGGSERVRPRRAHRSDQIVDQGAQLVILGSGDPAIEDEFRRVATERPHRVAVRLGFDARLASQIYAGADMLLMPSHFEPCGLNQMIAMRYGCIPIVHATGGLPIPCRSTTRSGAPGRVLFLRCMTRLPASHIWYGRWRPIETRWHGTCCIARAMAQDFSWAASARQYMTLYAHALAARHIAADLSVVYAWVEGWKCTLRTCYTGLGENKGEWDVYGRCSH